jgi:hypothetical protein
MNYITITDPHIWFDTEIEPGSVVYDDRRVLYFVIHGIGDRIHLDHHVFRASDGGILHPSWMEFPVKVLPPVTNTNQRIPGNP